ncbi:Hypothetical protein CINCED_3A003958 [Cinara cedri]|nr:Hypothetical protein CINCED_3A003958 [Cinara cedri]
MTYSIGKCFYYELHNTWTSICIGFIIVIKLFVKLSLDDDRIKEVGPNMACAEWLMKNGAQIRWKGCEEFVNHYNCLPIKSRGQQFQIEEVYAGRESSISSIGFPFFTGCKNISEVAFVGCHTINDEALSKLKILKDNLTTLKINGCMNVTDKGILTLEHLQ